MEDYSANPDYTACSKGGDQKGDSHTGSRLSNLLLHPKVENQRQSGNCHCVGHRKESRQPAMSVQNKGLVKAENHSTSCVRNQ